MADMVKCPLCGTMNPPDQKICQKCQTPLSGESFHPGQAPVKKDTGELEPILPDWLRDARETAKQTGLDERYQKSDQPQPPASNVDFLAGLQAQAGTEDDEDVPDWLASITGASRPKPKTEEPVEPTGVRWVETGRKDDFQQEEDVPDWLAGLQSPADGEGQKDELTEFFRESGAANDSFQSTFKPTPDSGDSSSQPASGDTPDWLKQMAAEAGEMKEEPVSETLDWISQTPAAPPEVPKAESSAPFVSSSDSDTPDWLRQLQADAKASASDFPEPSGTLFSSNAPDWLSQLQTDANASSDSQAPFIPPSSSETPDWLSKLQADVNTAQHTEEPEPSAFSADSPDWLKDLGKTSSGEVAPFIESTPVESEPFVSDGGLPSWLAPEEPKKSDSTPIWLQDKKEPSSDMPVWLASDEQQAEQPEKESPPSDDLLSDLPDWLKSVAPVPLVPDEPSPVPVLSGEPLPAVKPSSEPIPAFADDGSSGSGEGLFTEMPDWLSNALDTPKVTASAEPVTGSGVLPPSELPSWLEAMRPMGQAIPGSVSSMSDQTLEQRGALAGLQGVLPAGSGFAPTSKPKSYSNKLNVNEEQLKHAGIFEQILAAETAPENLITEQPLGASRGLRWAIAATLIGVILVTSFLRTQFLSVPIGVPSEVSFAVSVAQAIPEGAPVLVAVDYDASRAGEMEAAAAPLFDNLLLLKHPRLTFVSSNEAGSILTERFMNGPLAFHVQNGASYLNLGYLAGGQVGIRAFAQDPVNAMPVDITGQPVWDLPMLQDVRSLNQFALIILITDDTDAARTWVEQTQDVRGVVPIVAISSAQTSPMIQPYYDSKQVAGVISGVYGGAVVERQYNNGRPGISRGYWDAYSIGMLIAMILTLGGGFVNWGLGMNKRTTSKEGK